VRRGARAKTLVAAAALATMALAGLAAPASPTTAAWTDTERATSATLTAGRVTAVSTMSCTTPLGGPRFSWTAPTGGLTRTGYRWTVTGGLSGSGTLGANATNVQVSSGLLGIGTGTFSLYAVGPGGWESVAKTGTVSFVTAILFSCSVP